MILLGDVRWFYEKLRVQGVARMYRRRQSTATMRTLMSRALALQLRRCTLRELVSPRCPGPKGNRGCSRVVRGLCNRKSELYLGEESIDIEAPGRAPVM
jgi:hypothetical protein